MNKNPSTTFQVLALVGPTDDMYTPTGQKYMYVIFSLYISWKTNLILKKNL